MSCPFVDSQSAVRIVHTAAIVVPLRPLHRAPRSHREQSNDHHDLRHRQILHRSSPSSHRRLRIISASRDARFSGCGVLRVVVNLALIIRLGNWGHLFKGVFVPDIELLGNSYKVIEVAEKLPGSNREYSYAVVDVDNSVIWLDAATPVELRDSVLTEARAVASKVHRVRVGAAGS